MSVVHIDGFDNYATTALSLIYNGVNTTYFTVDAGAARTGSSGLRATTDSSGNLSAPWLVLPSTLTNAIVGFAFSVHALPSTTQVGAAILSFSDNTGPGSAGIRIVLTSTGTLRLYGASSAKSDNWTGTALTTGKWYYIEVKYKYTSSTAVGDVEIRVDYGSGPTVVNQIAASQDTRNGNNAGCGYVILGHTAGSGLTASTNMWDYDDLYVLNPSSGSNTTYLGDCTVECLFPSGAGASAQFTPNQAGHANYTEVNEASYDGDTTYVSTASVNNRDSYTLGSLSSTPQSIFAVQAVGYARVDAGETTRTFLESLRISGTYYDGATTADVTAGYKTYRTVWDTNPATSAAWDSTTVNGMEAGVKLVS